MGALYYSATTLGKVDEQYSLRSKVKGIINNGFTLNFTGVGTVSIQTVETVDEVDYVPLGTDRFGQMTELGNGTHEYTLPQDKAWTFSIDRKSREDTMGSMDVKKAVARQVRIVSIPNFDKYVLATVLAYAVTNSQVTENSGTALTTSNAYQYFLQLGEYLNDNDIENENIVVYMTRKKLNLLRRDPEFKVACDKAYDDSKKGTVVPIDGMSIIVVPASYLPANTGYLALADNVVAAPMKTNMTRILDDQRGIDGFVAEGRRRYGAFMGPNSGLAIVAHMEA